MKIITRQSILILLISILITSCNQSSTTQGNVTSDNSINKQISDSLIQKESQTNDSCLDKSLSTIEVSEKAIAAAEKDFFNSLRSFDKDFGKNSYYRMKKVLKANNVTPYDLYIDLTNLFKRAKEEATEKATSMGLRERNYTDFIGKIKDKYISDFRTRYGIDNELYICFINNYCSCLGDNSDEYCKDRKNVFPNSEFWH